VFVILCSAPQRTARGRAQRDRQGATSLVFLPVVGGEGDAPKAVWLDSLHADTPIAGRVGLPDPHHLKLCHAALVLRANRKLLAEREVVGRADR